MECIFIFFVVVQIGLFYKSNNKSILYKRISNYLQLKEIIINIHTYTYSLKRNMCSYRQDKTGY